MSSTVYALLPPATPAEVYARLGLLAQGNTAEAQELFQQALAAREPVSSTGAALDASEPDTWEDGGPGELQR